MNWWTRWCHEVMGWHPRRNVASSSFDGCSEHAVCLTCGYRGMIDSNGNLF